jgi:molybdate transport system substrate-binding protein
MAISRMTKYISCAPALAIVVVASLTAQAQDVRAMVSGGFSAAYKLLVPQFEKTHATHVESVFGPSMGTTTGAIPARLSHGEPAEVVIMARPALDELATRGDVVEGSQVDLARSRIAMAVRKGAAVPDIKSVAAFRRALLQARSVAYSDSASGVYIANELFKRLGIEKDMAPRSRRVAATPVGEIVARGEVEIGFQQLSELLPVPGIAVVGPIPEELQLVTVFSAGIVTKSPSQEAGRALIRFLASPAACEVIERTGMEPAACAVAHK